MGGGVESEEKTSPKGLGAHHALPEDERCSELGRKTPSYDCEYTTPMFSCDCEHTTPMFSCHCDNTTPMCSCHCEHTTPVLGGVMGAR